MQHTNFPLALKDWFKRYLAQMTYTVGVGRHSDEEVDAMFRHDLTMLSELLGMLYIFYTMSPYSAAAMWPKEASRGTFTSRVTNTTLYQIKASCLLIS